MALTHRPFGGRRIAPVFLSTQMLTAVGWGGATPASATAVIPILLPITMPPAIQSALRSDIPNSCLPFILSPFLLVTMKQTVSLRCAPILWLAWGRPASAFESAASFKRLQQSSPRPFWGHTRVAGELVDHPQIETRRLLAQDTPSEARSLREIADRPFLHTQPISIQLMRGVTARSQTAHN